MSKKMKKGKSTRRPTKAELAQRKKIQSIFIRIGLILILGLAASRLGLVGVTLYNLLRLVTGSAAYVLIGGLVIGVVFWNRLSRHEGMISGFLLFLAGVLLECQAYLDLSYKGSQLFQHTLRLAFQEIQGLQVTKFLGGGLLGGGLYLPISFLFANLGSFFIGALLIAFGLFFMSPWTVYDLADAFAYLREQHKIKSGIRAEKRAIRQAEKAEKEALKEAKRLEEEAAYEAELEAQRQARLLEEFDKEPGYLIVRRHIVGGVNSTLL